MTPKSKKVEPEQNGVVPDDDKITTFKVIFSVVFAQRDDKNEIVDELPLTNEQGPIQFVLYPPDFAKLPEKLEEIRQQALATRHQQASGQQNGLVE